MKPRKSWRKESPRPACAICRGRRRCCNCATASISCAAPKATNGRTSRTTRWRRPRRTGWRRCSFDKTALSQIGADDLDAALATLLPYKLRRRLDDEAPTHFTAPSGSSVPIDYEAPEGPKLSIRVQELFGLNKHPCDRRRPRAAGRRTALAGASAGAAHPRPAGFLARQLRRRAHRHARALSAPSLAGRSGQRAGDPARQAARDVNGIAAIDKILHIRFARSLRRAEEIIRARTCRLARRCISCGDNGADDIVLRSGTCAAFWSLAAMAIAIGALVPKLYNVDRPAKALHGGG